MYVNSRLGGAGFVLKAHRRLYHSTLGLRVIKKRKDLALPPPGRGCGRRGYRRQRWGRRRERPGLVRAFPARRILLPGPRCHSPHFFPLSPSLAGTHIHTHAHAHAHTHTQAQAHTHTHTHTHKHTHKKTGIHSWGICVSAVASAEGPKIFLKTFVLKNGPGQGQNLALTASLCSKLARQRCVCACACVGVGMWVCAKQSQPAPCQGDAITTHTHKRGMMPRGAPCLISQEN